MRDFHHGLLGGPVGFIFGVVLIIVFAIAIAKANKEEKKKTREAARRIIRDHIEALHVKRLQKRRRDDYGNILDGHWAKEIDYFYDSVLMPRLGGAAEIAVAPGQKPSSRPEIKNLPRIDVYQTLNEELDTYAANKSTSNIDVATLSPLAFESTCAELLIRGGWEATTTKASGDQGIDIVATRNGTKAIFQCKMQSAPVGNKAVQEAIAGKSWASADFAFVVSNADFTSAARELASKSHVHLIHYSTLSDLTPYIEPIGTNLKVANIKSKREHRFPTRSGASLKRNRGKH